MTDFIKESDIPVKNSLATELGFDADGNWAKRLPAGKAAPGVIGYARGLNAGIDIPASGVGAPQADTLKNVQFNNGTGTTIAQRLQEGTDLKQLASRSASLNYTAVFVLTGNYQGGWYDLNSGSAIFFLVGMLLVCKGMLVAWDAQRNGHMWVYTATKGWEPVGLGVDTPFQLPVATAVGLGGVKASDTVKVDDQGKATVPFADTATDVAGAAKVDVPTGGIIGQGINPAELGESVGAIEWHNGLGIPTAVKVLDTPYDLRILALQQRGIIYYLSGSQYTGAWREGIIRGLLIGAGGHAIGIDTYHNEIWLYEDPAGSANAQWTKLSGAGTVPLPADADFPDFPLTGVAVYTFEHPIKGMPSRLATSGLDYSGVLTMYPGGFATLLIGGIDPAFDTGPDDDPDAPYLTSNGLWSLVPTPQGSVWTKAYAVAFPQPIQPIT